MIDYLIFRLQFNFYCDFRFCMSDLAIWDLENGSSLEQIGCMDLNVKGEEHTIVFSKLISF